MQIGSILRDAHQGGVKINLNTRLF